MIKSNFKYLSFKYLIFIFVFIYFAFRLSVLNESIYNPDELEWIYCVTNAKFNWSIGSGFDSTSTGPISIWILLLYFKLVGNVSVFNLHLFILIIQFVLINFIYFSLPKPQNGIFILVVLCFLSYGNLDFVAYNTEWILFLFFPFIFKILKNKSINIATILIESMVIFLITLIKFQYLPLSFLLFLFQITKSLNLSHFTKVLSSYILCVILFCLFFSQSNLYLFFENYVYNNINYTKYFSNTTLLHTILIFINSFISIFNPLIYLGVLIIIHYSLNKTDFRFLKVFQIIKKYFKYLSVLLVLSISIILPRTNFSHYFIILIYPVTFLIVNLLNKFKNYIQLYVGLICVIFFYNIYHQRIILKKAWGYTDIISNYDYSNNHMNFIKLNFHDSIIVNDLDQYLVDYSSKNSNKKTIFIYGWFESLLLYYRYNNMYNPVFKCANSIFLNSKNELISKGYNNSIMQDFQNKEFPDLIVMKRDQFFNENTYVNKILKEKYIQDFSNINFKVFISKNNN